MRLDVIVKIPQEVIKEAKEELDRIPCLRKEVNFQSKNGQWGTSYSCHGFGTGKGVGFVCKEDCSLRITDLSRCIEVKHPNVPEISYLAQEGFYKLEEE